MDTDQNKSLYEPAIHFQNVSFEAGDTKILDSITGSFPTGQITVLVGPSGAGKTTLLKMCNGLLSPTGGEITIQGRAINEMSPIHLRRQAGMVLQNSPMILQPRVILIPSTLMLSLLQMKAQMQC